MILFNYKLTKIDNWQLDVKIGELCNSAVVNYQCGRHLTYLPHYLPVFFFLWYKHSQSCSCWRSTLFFFCSKGVKSGVIKTFRSGAGLLLEHSLSLLLRIVTLSRTEFSVTFKSLGLSDLIKLTFGLLQTTKERTPTVQLNIQSLNKLKPTINPIKCNYNNITERMPRVHQRDLMISRNAWNAL